MNLGASQQPQPTPTTTIAVRCNRRWGRWLRLGRTRTLLSHSNKPGQGRMATMPRLPAELLCVAVIEFDSLFLPSANFGSCGSGFSLVRASPCYCRSVARQLAALESLTDDRKLRKGSFGRSPHCLMRPIGRASLAWLPFLPATDKSLPVLFCSTLPPLYTGEETRI